MNVLYDFDDGKYMANFLFNDTLCKVVMVKGDPGEPTDAQVKTAVYEYLEEHPNTFNPEGEYEDFTAGNANQLTSNIYTEDTTPYIFRAVSDSSVEVGNREVIEQITGGTVAWNQLCNASSVTITSGHKYYMKKGTAYSIGASTGSAITGLTSGSDMVIDLTQMFGPTIADYIYNLEQSTAGAGVSLFKSLFPKDYYAYNAGELMSVKASARETTGKNLFDQSELIEGKHYNTSGVLETQAKRVSTPKIWCRGMSSIFLGYVSSVSSTNAIRCIWDADGNLINRTVPANTVIDGVNGYLTDLSSFPNACYIGYSFYSNNGSVVGSISDVIIANSTERISYIPYEKHTYPLSNIELRGIPKLVNNQIQYDGDIYKADGSVTRRYKAIDLGSLTWTYQSSSGNMYVDNVVADRLNDNTKVMAFSAKYEQQVGNYDSVAGLTVDKRFAFQRSLLGQIIVRDTAYTDAAAFKTAMSGVYLVYELATPTTETTITYTETQICSPYGTEEFIDDRDVQIPVGHYTKYPTDQVKKLDGLPSDFSTLIAPTESGTASRNYSVGQFLIMNNQLYKVTSAIASGAAITVGTNVTATTLAEQIIALLNQ